MRKTDFIIVGQGLAGTLLAHFLLLAGKEIVVIDAGNQDSASAVAAGVMNPITGRRFVKSWRADELFPFAATTYRDIEDLLGVRIFHPKPIVRSLPDVKSLNDWLCRADLPDIAHYVASENEHDLAAYRQTFHHLNQVATFRQGSHLNTRLLLSAYQNYLRERNIYLKQSFDYERLLLTESGLVFEGAKENGIAASKIIFCEGEQATRNPYFGYLPFQPAKGDALIVRIPDYPFGDQLLKHELFIVPLPDQLYWVGSNYNHHYTDSSPDPEGLQRLTQQLHEVLNLPFEVVKHLAAVRPAVKDRRPLLGQHPTLPNVCIFNGLGTKGASLSPLFAFQMTNFLVHHVPLDPEVNIHRFSL